MIESYSTQEIEEKLKILYQRKKIISELMKDIILTVPLGKEKLTKLWIKYIENQDERKNEKIFQKFHQKLEEFEIKHIRKGMTDGTNIESHWLEEYKKKTGQSVDNDIELFKFISKIINNSNSYNNIYDLEKEYLHITTLIKSLNERKEQLYKARTQNTNEENKKEEIQIKETTHQEISAKEKTMRMYEPIWIDFENPKQAFKSSNTALEVERVVSLSLTILNNAYRYYVNGISSYTPPQTYPYIDKSLLEQNQVAIEAYEEILTKFKNLEKKLTKEQKQYLSQIIHDTYKKKGVLRGSFVEIDEFDDIIGSKIATNNTIIEKIAQRPSKEKIEFITESMNAENVRKFYKSIMKKYILVDNNLMEEVKQKREVVEKQIINKLIQVCNIDIYNNSYEQIASELGIDISILGLEHIKRLSEKAQNTLEPEKKGKSR